jgi:small subunit ribosomal protein S18
MAKPRAGGRLKKKPGAPTQRKRRPQLSAEDIDWKNFPSLRRFVSERGKIRSRRITGLSRRQQNLVAKAVKRARQMGLLAYPDQDRGLRVTGPSGPPASARPTEAPAEVTEASLVAEAQEFIEATDAIETADVVDTPDAVDAPEAVEVPEAVEEPAEA